MELRLPQSVRGVASSLSFPLNGGVHLPVDSCGTTVLARFVVFEGAAQIVEGCAAQIFVVRPTVPARLWYVVHLPIVFFYPVLVILSCVFPLICCVDRSVFVLFEGAAQFILLLCWSCYC